MRRKAIFIEESRDKKRAIYVDEENAKEILAYFNQDEKHRKKFKYLVKMILDGLRMPELYDKEEPNKKCKGVTAMKPFKGGDNDRIYCKEFTTVKGTFIVITAELLLKKKTQSLNSKQIHLIEKVASYEYDIDERG
ncbi:MAG: hypothetical protein ACXWEY_11210 [Bacteroidia bacterium]